MIENTQLTTKGRKSGRQRWKHRTRATNVVAINPIISIVTWSVSGLEPPIQRWRLSEWIKKQKDKLHVVYKKFTLNIKVLCCAVLSYSAVSESLRPPWTVACQAPPALGILQARKQGG